MSEQSNRKIRVPQDFVDNLEADLHRIETNLSTLQEIINNTSTTDPLPDLDRAEALAASLCAHTHSIAVQVNLQVQNSAVLGESV